LVRIGDGEDYHHKECSYDIAHHLRQVILTHSGGFKR
jgi:hypothetical protein